MGHYAQGNPGWGGGLLKKSTAYWTAGIYHCKYKKLRLSTEWKFNTFPIGIYLELPIDDLEFHKVVYSITFDINAVVH